MNKFILSAILLLITLASNSQLLTWTPDFALDNGNIVITVDCSKGNQGLLNHSTTDVYVHTGVNTSLSTGPNDWKYVKNFGNPSIFNTPEPQLKATSIGNNKFTFSITNIRAYYGVPAGEVIKKINILFRSGDGQKKQANTDGSDMHIPVYTQGSYNVRLNQPFSEPKFIPVLEPINAVVGGSVVCLGVASESSNLTLSLNGTSFGTASATTTISGNASILQTCGQKIMLTGVSSINSALNNKDSAEFFIAPGTTTQALPAGMQDGINYGAGGTSVTLVLYAPNKTSAVAVGSFSNWQQACAYQMKKTPDGLRWWITINGIVPGQQYPFQYIVDGNLKIADPYAELILDQNDDPWLPTGVFPGLPAFPTQAAGVVSIFQSNTTTFAWTASSYVRPDKKDLVIHEILLRDFNFRKNWPSLTDSLDYFKNLGINAIELMPFNEFEGNNSWGYNPYFYFVPEKSYGTKAQLQKFIDEAHKKGIAVIMDIALNHTTGKSPLAQLYWNSATNKPLATNPWLNVDATHPFNVFNDFNHESEATKYHTARFIRHWLTEYKIDGFRWDLSKGFTQVNSGSNVGNWNNFDQSRINIWQRYYDSMQVVSPGSYCILEHLGNDDEEINLANRGMMPWGKMSDQYYQNSMGFSSSSDINRMFHRNRTNGANTYNEPLLIGFAESHDEERTMVKNLESGNSSNASHNVKDLNISLLRTQALMATILMVPGPKMLWQFEELGYDKSINTCTNGTISNNCRTDPKPILWNYFTTANRKRIYDVTAAMNKLRAAKNIAFRTNNLASGTNLGTDLLKSVVLNEPTLKMVCIANMDVNSRLQNFTFPTAGTYYDYINGGTFSATGSPQQLGFNPGEFKIYIDQNIPNGITTALPQIINPTNGLGLLIQSNPVTPASQIIAIVPKTGTIQIDIITSSGVVVNKIYNGLKTKGEHFINTNGLFEKIPTGLYFVRIMQNNQKHIVKIVK